MKDKAIANALDDFENAVESALGDILDDVALRIQAQACATVPLRHGTDILVESAGLPLGYRLIISEPDPD